MNASSARTETREVFHHPLKHRYGRVAYRTSRTQPPSQRPPAPPAAPWRGRRPLQQAPLHGAGPELLRENFRQRQPLACAEQPEPLLVAHRCGQTPLGLHVSRHARSETRQSSVALAGEVRERGVGTGVEEELAHHRAIANVAPNGAVHQRCVPILVLLIDSRPLIEQ